MEIVIQKLVVNCEVDDCPNPMDMGRETEQFITSKVLPLIEDIFTELVNGFSHLTIKDTTYNIDLTSEDNTLQGVTAASLRSALKQQILADIREKAEEISSAENIWRQFIFIVKKGYTPWGFRYKTHDHFEQQLLSDLGYIESNPSFITELTEVLGDENFVDRIANVFSTEFIVKMLLATYKNIHYTEDQILSDIDRILYLNDDNQGFNRNYLLLILLVHSFTTGQKTDVSTEAKKVIRSVIKIRPTDQAPDLTVKELHTTLQDLPGPNKRPGQPLPKQANGDNRPWQQEGVFIQNAGLVLLANFLPRFFTQLGLVKDNELTDPHKCVYLLQLLCGMEETEEYNLALNKILCGLEPEAILKRRKKFRKKDIAEAKNLLDSVITHWTALKNTSPETVKIIFLQRGSKLYFETDKAILQVEKKTEDVLLDYLPWSFGLIKLAWMKHPLKVKWNDEIRF